MTDPIERQRPLLVWGTDPTDMWKARKLLVDAGIPCSQEVAGKHYLLFCAYLDTAIPPDLDAQLRALVSRVQVSLSRK